MTEQTIYLSTGRVMKHQEVVGSVWLGQKASRSIGMHQDYNEVS